MARTTVPFYTLPSASRLPGRVVETLFNTSSGLMGPARSFIIFMSSGYTCNMITVCSWKH